MAGRGALVALARMGGLSGDVLRRSVEMHTSLAATVGWLEDAWILPKMVPPVAGWNYV
jgi:hypothetical protein